MDSIMIHAVKSLTIGEIRQDTIDGDPYQIQHIIIRKEDNTGLNITLFSPDGCKIEQLKKEYTDGK